MASTDNDGKAQGGLDLAKIVDLRSTASNRASELQSEANRIGAQVEFIDLLLQQHLGGASIDTHLALIGAGRRLATMLETEVKV